MIIIIIIIDIKIIIYGYLDLAIFHFLYFKAQARYVNYI